MAEVFGTAVVIVFMGILVICALGPFWMEPKP